jgi:hypothetical protein
MIEAAARFDRSREAETSRRHAGRWNRVFSRKRAFHRRSQAV